MHVKTVFARFSSIATTTYWVLATNSIPGAVVLTSKGPVRKGSSLAVMTQKHGMRKKLPVYRDARWTHHDLVAGLAHGTENRRIDSDNR
jgi:hypothetical protein